MDANRFVMALGRHLFEECQDGLEFGRKCHIKLQVVRKETIFNTRFHYRSGARLLILCEQSAADCSDSLEILQED